jgi:hypothetical protein
MKSEWPQQIFIAIMEGKFIRVILQVSNLNFDQPEFFSNLKNEKIVISVDPQPYSEDYWGYE